MSYTLISDDDYTNAEAFILTFSLNNYPRENPKFKLVQEWESRFLDIVQEYQKNPSTNFTFAYMAEVRLETLYCIYCISSCPCKSLGTEPRFGHYLSFKRKTFSISSLSISTFTSFSNPHSFIILQRSLEDEINRTTIEDIPIFMISYAVIFLYIAVALGEYSSFRRILVSQQVLACSFS